MTAPGRLRLRSSIALVGLLGSLFSATPARAQMVSTNCTYDGRSTVDLYMTGSGDGYIVTRDKRGAVTFSDYYGTTGPLACSGGGTANRATEVNVHGADISAETYQDIYVDLENFRGVSLDVDLGGDADVDYLTLWLTSRGDAFSETGGAGLSMFAYTSVEQVWVYGRGGADTLRWDATDVPEVLLYGGDGNDTLFASETQSIYLNGDAGDDSLYGGGVSDSISGGVGDDVIYGDAGDDYLYGQSGADRIYGGDGNDRLYGVDSRGKDLDLLDGQGGNDRCTSDARDVLTSCETVYKA